MDMETLLPLDFDRGLANFTKLSEIFHNLENLTTSKMSSTCIIVSVYMFQKLPNIPTNT
jgi:hypothetical protein